MGRIADTRELHPQLVSGRRATILIDDPEPQLELTRTCRAPDIGILVPVDSDDLEVILALLQAGATACVPRDGSVADLIQCIIAAGRGGIVLPAHKRAALARRAYPVAGAPDMLTDREVEVVQLLPQGRTDKEIAQTLMLSVRTIEGHLRSVFCKLEARSGCEAALWAMKHGFGDGA